MNSTAPSHGRNLRIGRVSLPNQIYHVTVATQSREQVFADFAAGSVAARCLYNQPNHLQTLCYVVMPGCFNSAAPQRYRKSFVHLKLKFQFR